MVDAEASLHRASHLHPLALLQYWYTTEMPIYWNPHCGLVVGDTEEGRYSRVITYWSTLSQCSEWGIQWFPWSSCPAEHISPILLAAIMRGLYMWQVAIYHRRSGRCPQPTALEWSLCCRCQSRCAVFVRCSWMRCGKHTERNWTKYSGGYSSLSPWNKIPALRAGIRTFSVQMETSGIAN